MAEPFAFTVQFMDQAEGALADRVVAAWETSSPHFLVTYATAWTVTHRPTARSAVNSCCCRRHAMELVADHFDADQVWAVDSYEAMVTDPDRYVPVLRAASAEAWKCELYADLVSDEEATSIVAICHGLDADDVGRVLEAGRTAHVVVPPHNCPEVDW